MYILMHLVSGKLTHKKWRGREGNSGQFRKVREFKKKHNWMNSSSSIERHLIELNYPSGEYILKEKNGQTIYRGEIGWKL